MKTILVAVVGTVGLVATPAVAGTPKKQPTTKPTIEAKRIAEIDTKAAGPADVGPVAVSRVSPLADATLPAELTPSPELLGIPELPADTSNAFSQFDLVKARPVTLAAPAKSAKSKKEKTPVLNLGENFVLGGKKKVESTPHEEVQQIIPRGLTDAQVSTVVQKSSSDVQLCWSKLPAAQRADACTAMMKLSINDEGNVTAVELGGDIPASTHACITSAVMHWQFPTAETSTVTETGVSLRSL